MPAAPGSTTFLVGITGRGNAATASHVAYISPLRCSPGAIPDLAFIRLVNVIGDPQHTLRRLGAPATRATIEGRPGGVTPLHVAAMAGSRPFVELLLKVRRRSLWSLVRSLTRARRSRVRATCKLPTSAGRTRTCRASTAGRRRTARLRAGGAPRTYPTVITFKSQSARAGPCARASTN